MIKEDEIDQEMVDRIKEEAEKEQVPERLSPLAIKAMLESEGVKGKKGGMKNIRAMVAMAAAACMLISVVGVGALFLKTKDQSSQQINVGGEETAEVSYDGVYDLFSNYKVNNRFYGIQEDATVGKSTGASTTDQVTSSGKTEDVSQTNTQVADVDEGDLIKTDGAYIYYKKFDQSSFEIVKVEAEKISKVATIDVKYNMSECYIKGDLLVLVGTQPQGEDLRSGAVDDFMYPSGKVYTHYMFYNVAKREKPVLIHDIKVDGQYASSRIYKGFFYGLTTVNDIEYDKLKKEIPKTYVPSVNDKVVSCKDIYISKAAQVKEGEQQLKYVVVTAIDLNDPTKVTDEKAIVTNSTDVYVSTNHIYIYGTTYSSTKESEEFGEHDTIITKLSYGEGKFSTIKSGKIEGTIHNSFSLDEYKGNLRVVTTVEQYTQKEEKTYNNLYVLNEDMAVVGKITELAENETIYSARFMGEVGYFVTYRQTDPLFSVDLSNPANPKIIGKLKIPGFSRYLHFYGKNLLLGIGEEDESLKLSMFDITDPSDVKEISKKILNKVSMADVFYDHRAVLIDTEKNLFGFGYSKYLKWMYNGTERRIYQLFTWSEEKGFTSLKKIYFSGDEQLPRAVFSKGVLYATDFQNCIKAFEMEKYKQIGQLDLGN